MLFNLPNKKDQKESAGAAGEFTGLHQFPISSKLEDTLTLLKDGSCIHWVSDGDWSMHELMIGVLRLAGPAELFISTYAVTEMPARMIADLVQQKVIKKLYCILDKRIDVRSASAFNVVKSACTRLELVNTHAKVTVIMGKKLNVAVICSANYTTNRRYECGVIIADREVAEFHKNWILYAIDNH